MTQKIQNVDAGGGVEGDFALKCWQGLNRHFSENVGEIFAQEITKNGKRKRGMKESDVIVTRGRRFCASKRRRFVFEWEK
jgi:hypothetical protein